MANNVIHVRRHTCGNEAAGVYVDSQDRGPKGETGRDGKTGDTGVSVKSIEMNAEEHLIVTFDDGRKQDVGEIPKIISQRVFVTEIDGSTNTIPLVMDGNRVEIEQERVSFILLNGVMFVDGFTIRNGNITLNCYDEVPAGRLEIFTLSHGVNGNSGAVTSVNGQYGDVKLATISDVDIENIVNGKDE